MRRGPDRFLNEGFPNFILQFVNPLKVIVISAKLCQRVRVILHESYDPVQVPSLPRALFGPPVDKPGIAPDGGTVLQPGKYLLHVGHLLLQAHG